MTRHDIFIRQEAVPFVPYSLFLADGRELAVEHPELVSLAAYSRSLTLIQPGGYAEVIDLRLIVSLKFRSDEAVPDLLTES